MKKRAGIGIGGLALKKGVYKAAWYFYSYHEWMRYTGKKGKVWEAVKQSVRRREKHCYTCPKRNLEGANAQAGHYKPVAIVGSNSLWSWDPRFIHLQCARCNGAGQGEQVAYRLHLVKDYGEDTVNEFDTSWRKVNPVKDWDAVIHTFKNIGLQKTPNP